MVAEKGLQIDMGDGNMQCSNHHDQTNIAGGICAVCLQEKLGNLVSSSSSSAAPSFPIPVFPSFSPSSSPSFRSEHGGAATSATVSLPPSDRYSYSKRTRIPFLPTKKKKKKDPLPLAASSDQDSFVFKRSKSVAAARRGLHFTAPDGDSPRRRGLWSFLYLSKHASNGKIDSFKSSSTMGASSSNGSFSQRSNEQMAVVDENESPIQTAFDRKVSRSRSVGCGSRSFSGDFFERISTGFGDCTLRRVESQREGKPKINPAHYHRRGGGGGGQECTKQRVKCGGIFSGFTITSSSSSSSSSSYLVSSSAEDNYVNGKPPSAAATGGHLVNGRSKSWGWAFASPMRAFSKREASNKNTTTNLNAIPSLLS